MPSVLIGFEDGIASNSRASYLNWVRSVAEAKWFEQGLSELPWWKNARDINEILESDEHPEATIFDGQALEEDRPTIALADFMNLFEHASGHNIMELSSPLRTFDLTQGRIELTLLAVARFGLRSTELAALLDKHQSSLTRWLNRGLKSEIEDQQFRDRINDLDAEISAAAQHLLPTKR